MSSKPYLIAFLATTSVTVGITLPQPSQAQAAKFACAADSKNIPTTYAQVPSGAVAIFRWTSNYFQAPYTPMQRCLEVSDRLNQLRPEYLSSGRVNNHNVICGGNSCSSDGSNVLLTLRPDQNPARVLEEIDQNRHGAAGPSNQLSGNSRPQETRPSNIQKTSDGSVALHLNGYIQTAPKVPMRLSGDSSQTAPNSTLNSLPKTQPSPSHLRTW